MGRLRPKIKHLAFIGDYNYREGGLKDINIDAKFKSLNLTWIKRLEAIACYLLSCAGWL